MRAKLIFVGGCIGCLALIANGQTTGGGASGAATAPPTASGTVQVQSQGTTPSQTTAPQTVQPRQQASPALQNRLQARAAGGTTNNFGANGQLRSTNAFAATNGAFRTNTPGWSPTGRSGATNSVYWNSNNGSFASTNRTSAMFQDRAATTADQSLLVSIRQTVVARLQPLGAWSPAVHFQVNSGIVTLVGVVTTIQISQQIESNVAQVPGVIRVVNNLRVTSSAGFNGQSFVPTAQTNSAAVTN